jgi:hypothetical protein
MGCANSEARKSPGTDISANSPDVQDLMDAYPQHRLLILNLFETIRTFSSELSYDRWFRVIKDELNRIPPRNVQLPAIEAPIDLKQLLKEADSGHICVGKLRKGEMLYILGIIFRDMQLSSAFQISPENFMEFARGASMHMRGAYHGFEYGFMSAICLFSLMQNSACLQRVLEPKDKFALFLATFGCVFAHPCKTNTFLIKTKHTLALTYLNDAVTEQHCAQEFISHVQDYSFFDHLPTDLGNDVLLKVKTLIRGLDSRRQARNIGKWRAVASGNSLVVNEQYKQQLMFLISSAATAWHVLICAECKAALEKHLEHEYDEEAKEAKRSNTTLDESERAHFSLTHNSMLHKELWSEVLEHILDQSVFKERALALLTH